MGCGCSNYSGNEYNNAAGPGLIPGGKGWGRTEQPWEPDPLHQI